MCEIKMWWTVKRELAENAWDSRARCTCETWQGCCCLWKFNTV